MSKLRLALLGLMGVIPVQSYAFDISFEQSTCAALNSNTVQVNNIRVDTEIANPFDPSRPDIYSIYYDVPFVFDVDSLHLVPNLGSAAPAPGTDDNGSCANLSVIVNNAVTGNALSGASITVRSNAQNTNETGQVTLSGLPAGNALVATSLPGYDADQTSKELACGDNTLSVALNPNTPAEGGLRPDQIRVVLTWGENPVDVDAHLTGPAPGLAATDRNDVDRFHVYWYNSSSGDNVATLDVDDVASFGPETITISPPSDGTGLRPGVYRYSLHHYEGSDVMADAQVKLFVGNEVARTFTPNASQLQGVSDIWTVFELSVNNGQVTVLPVNTYSQGASGTVRRAVDAHYGEAESARIMTQHK
jgi:hypothetical protein